MQTCLQTCLQNSRLDVFGFSSAYSSMSEGHDEPEHFHCMCWATLFVVFLANLSESTFYFHFRVTAHSMGNTCNLIAMRHWLARIAFISSGGLLIYMMWYDSPSPLATLVHAWSNAWSVFVDVWHSQIMLPINLKGLRHSADPLFL